MTPDSVKYTKDEPFRNSLFEHTGIQNIKLGSNIEFIDRYAFGNRLIAEIKLPEELVSLNEMSLIVVKFPESALFSTINKFLFSGFQNIEKNSLNII